MFNFGRNFQLLHFETCHKHFKAQNVLILGQIWVSCVKGDTKGTPKCLDCYIQLSKHYSVIFLSILCHNATSSPKITNKSLTWYSVWILLRKCDISRVNIVKGTPNTFLTFFQKVKELGLILPGNFCKPCPSNVLSLV